MSKSFWRKEEPVFDDTGQVVRGGMWQPQRAWWELPSFIRIYTGGYGAGKTNIHCKRAIAVSLENAPAPYGLVSPTFAMARETTIESLHELLQGKTSLCPGMRYFFNQTKNQFRIFHRGRMGTIKIYSGEDPRRLRGPNLGAAGIDEPFIQAREVFEQMVARIRHPRAKRKELNLTGTPEELNWGYDLVEGDLRKKYDVGVVRAPTTCNKALGPEYAKWLAEVLDERTARAYIGGEFLNLASGLALPCFDPRDHVVDIPRPSDSELIAGIDFNVNPMSAMVYWLRGSHLHGIAEYELKNSDTYELAQVLRRDWWDKGLRKVYPDSNAGRSTSSPGGKTDYHFLEEAGFEIFRKNSNPNVRDRFNAVNGKLRPAVGETSLTYSPACKKFRRYALTYRLDARNNKANRAMSHLIDAATYPVCYLFPVDPNTIREVRLQGY